MWATVSAVAAKVSPLFRYSGFVRSVYDGDTVRIDLDLGFGIKWENQSVRLFGLNAPEVRGAERPKGLKSRDWLRAQILDRDVVVRTFLDKRGKYGRTLGVVYIPSEDGSGWRCINEEMLRRRLAKRALYGSKWTGWPTL